MINKAPAYQWYPKDILASVRVSEMPADVECWYRRALDFCWVNGSIPAEPKRCAAMIGKGCTAEGAAWVLTMFTTSRKDSTQKIHDRQEVERKKQAANRRKNSDAGKASAEKRRKDRELKAQKEVNERSTDVEIPFNQNPTLQSSSSTAVYEEEVYDAGEASFASQVMDGIREELNVMQITNEPLWLIEIERAEKNRFSVEHCIETFQLMHKQDWRDSPIKPATWSDNLPILNKLKAKAGNNGTNRPKSEREKSASRTINAERMAVALYNDDTETLRSILGVDDENNIKGYLPS